MKPVDPAHLSAFLAVAKARSFRRAAERLGVSPSALSHTLRELEERMGIRLLNRTTRSVAPTEAGGRLIERLGPAFRDIAEALQEVESLRDVPAGLLRLNVPRAAADLVLPELAGPFLRAHPDIELDITVDDALVDIVAGGFDAGIRFGEQLQRDMVAVPIGRNQRFAVVGSPDYFRRNPRPLTPRDLIDHACVRLRFASRGIYAWEFGKDGEEMAVAVDGPLTAGQPAISLQAALDGLAIALLYEGYVVDHLAEGRLERVLEDWCPAFSSFFLYYPSRRQMPPSLRAFVDFTRRARG